jgi:hypothetical protein
LQAYDATLRSLWPRFAREALAAHDLSQYRTAWRWRSTDTYLVKVPPQKLQACCRTGDGCTIALNLHALLQKRGGFPSRAGEMRLVH